jgi:hypothetical protein
MVSSERSKIVQYFIFYTQFDILYILKSKYTNKKIPSKIDKLILVNITNAKLKNKFKIIFSSNLRSLELDHFNQPISNLPRSLRILVFDCYFNQSIDELPEKLKVLKLGKKFNKSITNIPKALKNINFL